ncbi:CD1871A family CXXC motif-containing protein [Clostridium oceanicum]
MKSKAQISLLILGIAFIALGIYRKEVSLILKKAIKL